MSSNILQATHALLIVVFFKRRLSVYRGCACSYELMFLMNRRIRSLCTYKKCKAFCNSIVYKQIAPTQCTLFSMVKAARPIYCNVTTLIVQSVSSIYSATGINLTKLKEVLKYRTIFSHLISSLVNMCWVSGVIQCKNSL